MRILIVDDEQAIRQLLGLRLKSLGYEVYSAEDGLEALQLVDQIRPSVIILDINMPQMDGYQVLERLRKSEHGARVNVLMLTARAQVQEIEKGLLAGADDYLTKPFDLRELVARVKAALRIQNLQQQQLLMNEQLLKTKQALEESLREQQRLNQRISRELEVAARLQHSLLPPTQMILGKCRFAACYRPSSKIGGDFYDVRKRDDGRVGILLADAAGHGVSAALLAAMLKMVLEEAMAHPSSPAAILAELNRKFQFCADHGDFLSAVLALVDPTAGGIVYSVAGHVPPLLYRAKSRHVEELNTSGYCLGIFENGSYEDREIQLKPGDRLVLFTDGLSDATANGEEPFGLRLPSILVETADLPNAGFIEHLEKKLGDFLECGQPDDDYTLLAIHLE